MYVSADRKHSAPSTAWGASFISDPDLLSKRLSQVLLLMLRLERSREMRQLTKVPSPEVQSQDGDPACGSQVLACPLSPGSCLSDRLSPPSAPPQISGIPACPTHVPHRLKESRLRLACRTPTPRDKGCLKTISLASSNTWSLTLAPDTEPPKPLAFPG